jgi:hypothetical protein
MFFKVTGTIEFEPENVTRKHERQSDWKRVAMIRTHCDMHFYYCWFLKRRFNLELNRPLRGSHVTFISDRMSREPFEEAKKIFDGKSITFYLDTEPKTNGEHWWLRAYSREANDIREAMGLERDPYFGLHFTLGYANEKNIAHSEYILNKCKEFNLIPYEPRLSNNEVEERAVNFNLGQI